VTIESYPVTSKGDWLALRKRDVTASEIGALFGRHRYKTILQLFADKTGADAGFKGDTSAMRRGRLMEPAIAQAVREERPNWSVEYAGEYLRDPETRIGCTPDFYFFDNAAPEQGRGILEIKSVAPTAFAAQWAEGPPMMYVLQTLVQMMLSGCSHGQIACGVFQRDLPLYLYEVPRNAAVEQMILDKVAEFWASVEAGQEPAADPARDGNAIAALYPVALAGKTVELWGDNYVTDILHERAGLMKTIGESKKRVEAIDGEIKVRMTDAEIATHPDFRITWRLVGKKAFTVPAQSYRLLKVTDLRKDL